MIRIEEFQEVLLHPLGSEKYFQDVSISHQRIQEIIGLIQSYGIQIVSFLF